jgi:hypothetical protein
MPDGFGEARLVADFLGGDRIVIDNSLKTASNPDGIAFSGIKGRTFERNGRDFVEVHEFEIDGFSRNSSVGKQSAEIVTRDSLHDPNFRPLVVEWRGEHFEDDVRTFLEARVAGATSAPDWFV